MLPPSQHAQALRDIQFEEMKRQIQQLQETVNKQQALLKARIRGSDNDESRRDSSSFRIRRPQKQHFQTRCHIQGRLCYVIIDSNNCSNLVSSRVVSKLNLEILEHNIVKVPISIGKYKDVIFCQVTPMETCHILLGRPWTIANEAKFLGPSNTLNFWHGRRTITIDPLSLEDALADQNKLREKIEQERKENERKELELREKERKELELRKKEREEVERKELEEKKAKEKEEKEAKEKEEIQNNNASNMLSIFSSCSFVQEFGKQVEIIPSTPLFIKPNFGSPIQGFKENINNISTVIPSMLLHIQPLNNNILNSRSDSLEEGEYGVAQKKRIQDLNIVVWTAPRNTRTCLVLLPETDKMKVKYLKFVFDPGGDQDIH